MTLRLAGIFLLVATASTACKPRTDSSLAGVHVIAPGASLNLMLWQNANLQFVLNVNSWYLQTGRQEEEILVLLSRKEEVPLYRTSRPIPLTSALIIPLMN